MGSLRHLAVRSTGAVAIVILCFLATSGVVFLLWRPAAPHADSIRIVDATYGGNCAAASGAPRSNFVKRGNATASVMQSCENTDLYCPYIVDRLLLGDPAAGCDKDFEANWRCGRDQAVHQIKLQPEAHGRIAWLGCPETTP